MTAATAYCTSSTAFHQHSLSSPRSQFTSIPRRTTFSSTTVISHIEESTIINTKSDENNNDHQIEDTAIESSSEVLYITSDCEDNDDNDVDHIEPTLDDINEEEYLAQIGLRSKYKTPNVSTLPIQPLTKRLAIPVCLLPLPENLERVRQALYIRLPRLKTLPITYNIENFCSTDENAKAQSLLPRSNAQRRALAILNKRSKKQKLRKTELINIAAHALPNQRSKTSMSKYVHSILQCHVFLDRLEQSTIDQIMQNSAEDDDKYIPISLTSSDATTITTEKPIVKRKSTTESIKPKRFKSVNNNCAIINDNSNDMKTKHDPLSSSSYERIYLKCFVCSKREYIDAQATDSDVLHSHWLEHGGDLSLNIYDSEIDGILTRVVDFFKLPKQYMLEGKIKTIFILDSKEVRCTSTSNSLSDDCIVID